MSSTLGCHADDMRAVWSGAVSFGLVSIAVKAYAATEDKDVHFHQVHRTDGGRVRYQRVCELDDQKLDYADIAKGYTLNNGDMLVLEKSDFDNIPLPTTQEIQVLEFVPQDQIDPIRYARAYYLESNKADKPYTLLRDVLADSDVVAIVKVAMRQREQLATIRCHEEVLVLNTMRWPDEVRAPAMVTLDSSVAPSKRELDMARTLVDSMTSAKFDDSVYNDEYRDALQQMIDAKVSGSDVVTAKPDTKDADVIDLTEALKASMNRRQQRSSKTTASTGKKKTAAKRDTAKKKATAKKTTQARDHKKAS